MLRRATALKRICDRQRVQNAENDSFEKSIFESTEKARYETFCETLKFIYGEDFKNIMPNWSNDASKEFYSRK